MHLNWILNPGKIIRNDDRLEVLPSHLSTNGYLIYWALIMVKDSKKKMLKRKRAMEAVTETLKFG